MAFNYLSNDVLVGFDKYKYSSVDTSPVSKYVTHPFWNWCVEYIPRWIAPNVLTFVGFLFLVLQWACFTYYDPVFYASDDTHPEYPPCPSWVWLFAGLCMFLAHTLDGCDGKQARRTGTSGPLGELFDHGLDSWATLFMPIGMYSIFGRGAYSLPVERVYYVLLGVMLTFLFSHWEKYNTGTLFLPWGYDLSQIGMTLLYVITYFSSYGLWQEPVPIIGVTSGQMFEFIMHMSVYAFSIPMCLYNIFVAYRQGTLKHSSFYESQRPFIPVVIEFAAFLLWANYSSYDILRKQPRLFYFVTGTVFSNITCRLIVDAMSNVRCQAFNWVLIPLMAITTGVMTLQLGVIESYMLWAYAILITAAHLHYGICVVQQLADHFNIYVFSVEKPEKKD